MVSYDEFTMALEETSSSVMDQMRRGITYLNALNLPEMDKLYLSFLATSMFLNNEDERIFCTEEYQGKIKNTGKYQTLVTLSGQLFEIELETESGRTNASFLVSETTPGSDHDNFVRRN